MQEASAPAPGPKPPGATTSTGRLEVVDWLRGLAVVLMILAHGMDAWLVPAAKSGAGYEVIRLLSGLPARLFLLLVGVSAAIQIEAGLRKGVPASVLRGRLLRRGLVVLALAYVFRLQEWVLSSFYGGWETLFRVDILNAIGASMLMVGLVSTPRGGRRQLAPSLAVAAVFALALAAAVLAWALLAFVPALLKARLNISALLSSFLLSAALLPVLDYLVGGPLRDQSKNLLATAPIASWFRLTPLARPSLFNVSFFVAAGLAVAAGVFLRKTGPGYRLRMTGIAPDFARFAGFPADGISMAGMAASGAFHGLTGFFAITGTWYVCHQGLSGGMGWSALAAALIARQNPFAVIPSAILLAWLETATDSALLSTRFGFDSTSIVQAVLLLVISARAMPRRATAGKAARGNPA